MTDTAASENNNNNSTEIKTNNTTEQPFSYVAEVGEWKTRKISLFGVAKAFVSQLSVGQDLTRVTMPSVFLHPYSMLEVIALRQMVHLPVLFGIAEKQDPFERMLTVVKRYIAFLKQEDFEKKPYNPILGEVHHTWIETPLDDGSTEKTFYISEQVSHHPPISAYAIANKRHNIAIIGNITFNVKFGGNHASVTTDGRSIIHVNNNNVNSSDDNQPINEQYEMSKGLPDMVVTNVILGTKRVFWDGDVNITCKKTGYSAKITFKAVNNKNVVEGSISNKDKVEVLNFKGLCGEIVYYWDPRDESNNNNNNNNTQQQSSGYWGMGKIGGWMGLGGKKEAVRDHSHDDILMDISTLHHARLNYLSIDKHDDWSSYNVWKDLTHNIVINDMYKADVAKKIVEDAQRQRVKERKEKGINYYPKHFEQNLSNGDLSNADQSFWQYKGNLEYLPTKITLDKVEWL